MLHHAYETRQDHHRELGPEPHSETVWRNLARLYDFLMLDQAYVSRQDHHRELGPEPHSETVRRNIPPYTHS
jgi:hypothetical protein